MSIPRAGRIFADTNLILTTRARLDFQPTLQNLVGDIRKHVIVVCYPGERKRHLRNWYGDEVKAVIDHPKKLTHLGSIRRWCIEDLSDKDIILLDDNLNFHARVQSELGEDCEYPLHVLTETHYSKRTIRDIQLNMFYDMVHKLKEDKWGIVGISTRPGNNRMPNQFRENTRFFGLWSVNRRLYYQARPKLYGDYQSKNDFCLGLEMLTAGIPNIVLYKYAFGKYGGANNKGGCSTYRTAELMQSYADRLMKDFPAFVTVRSKSTKSWKGDFEETAKDVFVQWKKAYLSGVRKNIGFF